MDEEIRAVVRIEFTGEPQGLKKGGIRTIVTDQAEVKCMPHNLPESISIDVSSLEVGDTLYAAKLVMPKGVELLTSPSEVLLSIAPKQKETTPGEAADEAAASLE